MAAKSLAVVLEVVPKKAFAIAIDWPGWARSGKDEEQAIEALADYSARYAAVARTAGVRFAATAADHVDVVGTVDGGGATSFGVPYEVVEQDHEPLTKAQAARQGKLLAAAWTTFDDVVRHAPATLRKGPRGGGRDRDKIVEHVVAAEAAYGRSLGLAMKAPDWRDAAAVTAMRDELLALLSAPSDGTPFTAKGWPSRYGARRVAWHVLDHAWEIEDKSE